MWPSGIFSFRILFFIPNVTQTCNVLHHRDKPISYAKWRRWADIYLSCVKPRGERCYRRLRQPLLCGWLLAEAGRVREARDERPRHGRGADSAITHARCASRLFFVAVPISFRSNRLLVDSWKAIQIRIKVRTRAGATRWAPITHDPQNTFWVFFNTLFSLYVYQR